MKEGPRGLKPQEFDSLLQLVNHIFPGTKGKSPCMADLYPLLYEDPDLENKRVIVEDGKVVSHIGFRVWDVMIYGCRVRIGSIGSVATYEEYRNRGYATSLLLDSFQRLVEKGACLAFISGARGLYLRNQSVRISRMFVATLKKENLSWRSDGFEVTPYQGEHLDSYIRLYQREPLRYVRPRHEFKRALEIKTELPEPMWQQKVLGVWRDGELCAYAVIRSLFVGNGANQVREYAGSREALVRSLPSILSQCGVDEARLLIQPEDIELVRLLGERGIAVSSEPLMGTVRIVHFTRLLDSLEGLIRERSAEKGEPGLSWRGEGDHGAFVLDDESFEIPDARTAAEVIFGTVQGISPMVSEAPPRLRETLQRVLPVPFPVSGLNSI